MKVPPLEPAPFLPCSPMLVQGSLWGSVFNSSSGNGWKLNILLFVGFRLCSPVGGLVVMLRIDCRGLGHHPVLVTSPNPEKSLGQLGSKLTLPIWGGFFKVEARTLEKGVQTFFLVDSPDEGGVLAGHTGSRNDTHLLITISQPTVLIPLRFWKLGLLLFPFLLSPTLLPTTTLAELFLGSGAQQESGNHLHKQHTRWDVISLCYKVFVFLVIISFDFPWKFGFWSTG